METGYSLLADFGGEVPGYGLYSYGIAVNDSDRSARFLSDVFKGIPAVEDTPAQRSQTNIFYIPLKNNKLKQFLKLLDRAVVKGEPLSAASAYYALSDVHERAFPEIIDAFKAQVKREDFSDRAKIDTLRLKLLSIILTAADVTGPVQKAMADIVHSASGLSEKDKK
jgi:hypothetical protein